MTTTSLRNTTSPKGLSSARRFGDIATTPTQRALLARLDQEADAGRVVEDRHVQPDRFFRQHLHHEARRTRAAARRAADLVVVGLIAQHAPEPILRDRQSHELQGRKRARRPHRFDIGRVLVHRAARAERLGHGSVIVALSRAVGGVQGLLVGTGAGGRAAKGALGHDDDVEVAPLHFDRRPQPSRAAAEDKSFAPMDGN